MSGRILVYGGRGALGAACVSHFKAQNWVSKVKCETLKMKIISRNQSFQWVLSIDLAENEQADANVLVPRDATWEEQETVVLGQVATSLNAEKLDGVICVAGGWAGGNAAKDLAKNSDLMWKQSVWSSTISATIAAKHLKDGGFLSLTGAKAALDGTPGMIGYGMAKAAVHQLTKSLAGKDSGMPANSMVASILPITLDTPMNRKWMPSADFSTWTPLAFIAEYVHLKINIYYNMPILLLFYRSRTFWKWANGMERPSNGSLVQLVTTDSQTKLVVD